MQQHSKRALSSCLANHTQLTGFVMGWCRSILLAQSSCCNLYLHSWSLQPATHLTPGVVCMAIVQVSFHKYGDYFPGTGSIKDVGYARGKHYTVNVPLQEGMDDESYRFVYEPIMAKV